MTWGTGWGFSWGGRTEDLHEAVTKRKQLILELHLPRCQLAYGFGACTAAVGTTGDDRCYNTFATCQDRANFDGEDVVYRYCLAEGPGLKGENAWRAIEKISTVGGEIDIKGGLSGATKVTVTLRDFQADHDSQDPYRKFRKNPKQFHLLRLKKRNKHYPNRKAILREVFVGPDGRPRIGAGRAREFVIESFGWKRGKGTIVLKDFRKRLQETSFPVPVDAELSTAMGVGDTSLTLKSGQGEAFDEYGAPSPSNPIHIQVGKEVIKCEGRSGDSLTSLTRGAVGDTGSESATAAEHAADEKVVLGYSQEGARLDDVLEDIYERSGLVSGQWDATTMTSEVDTWLAGDLLTFYLFRETKADELVKQIVTPYQCQVWSDPERQLLGFRHIHPREPGQAAVKLNDSAHILEGGADLDDEDDRRVTRVIIYYGVRDWSANLRPSEGDVLKTYRRVVASIGSDEESADGYQHVKAEIIYAWMAPASARADIVSMAFRRLSRLKDAPQPITVELEAADGYELELGDLVDVTTAEVIDDAGNPLETESFVRSKRLLGADSIRYRVTLEPTRLEDRWGFINENSAPDYGSADDDDKALAYIADSDSLQVGDDDPYLIV